MIHWWQTFCFVLLKMSSFHLEVHERFAVIFFLHNKNVTPFPYGICCFWFWEVSYQLNCCFFGRDINPPQLPSPWWLLIFSFPLLQAVLFSCSKHRIILITWFVFGGLHAPAISCHSSILEYSRLLSLHLAPTSFLLPSPVRIFLLYLLQFLPFMHFPSFCPLVFHSGYFLLIYFLVHYVSKLLLIQSSKFIALVTTLWNSRIFIDSVFISLYFF